MHYSTNRYILVITIIVIVLLALKLHVRILELFLNAACFQQ